MITILLEVIVKVFTTEDTVAKCLVILLMAPIYISCNKDVKELTIRVRSRMYVSFQEQHVVKMYEKFSLSDTEMEAVAVEFLPDFAIDTLTHKAFSKTDTLNNPAVKILIVEGADKREEVWAFRPGLIPHFSPKSFIGFELVDIKVGGEYKLPVAEKENEKSH
jgi:hypothetical protein